MNNYIIVNCPHCNSLIYIEKKDFNCHIFRHGVYKDTLKQIDPHLDKDSCDTLKKDNLIYGCGKPFKIINRANVNIAVVCEYI